MKYTLYDCVTPTSTVTELSYSATLNNDKFELDIGPSTHSYVLVIHAEGKPTGVTVDGQSVSQLTSAAEFLAADIGWYAGAGVFAGSQTLATVNVRLKGGANKAHTVLVNNISQVSTRLSTNSALEMTYCELLQESGRVIKVPMSLSRGEQILKMEILDSKGRLVDKSSGSHQLHMSSLNRGNYLLMISTTKTTKTLRLKELH